MKTAGIAEELMKKKYAKKEEKKFGEEKEDEEPAEEKAEMGQTLLDAIKEGDAQAVADAITALIHANV